MTNKVICFLVDSMRRGGKERRLYELINSVSNDYRCCLILMDRRLEFDIPTNVDIRYFEKSKLTIINIFALYKLLKSLQPDIIHSWYYEFSVFAHSYVSLNSVKFISSEITNCSPPFKTKASIHFMLYRMTFWLAHNVTSNTAEGLKVYEVPKRKGIVIKNGFNESRLQEIDSKHEIIENRTNFLTVLMVANYTTKKDHMTIIKSGIRVLIKLPNVIFVFVGKGERQSILESYIPAEYKDRFFFTGFVDDVDSYIRKADLCVLSTFTEGLSNALMEYMAFGKPTIATGAGGSREIIENQHNGILLNQGDVEGMTDWILKLLQDKEYSNRIGKNAKSYVRQYLSLEKMIESFNKLYD